MITAKELKEKYLEFFRKRGHTIVASASLIPENDPTVLFTTAGMHPLVPYLTGQKHPGGKRLADVQKCIRTGDIDQVGDSVHLTFFEMLGNWSLGDYWKKEAIVWSFEFLNQELGIPVDKLAVSCFAGDKAVPKDDESAQIWQSVGLPKEKIFFYGRDQNWWGPAGQTGPCGPDTEMYYDTGKPECANCKANGPACDCHKYVEIWNDVFMQYNKTADGRYEELSQKNVDTGMGVERTVAVLNGQASVFEIESFQPIVNKILELAKSDNERSVRIIADHLRAATFILGDERGIVPSNVEQGYVLRRLIRRAIRYGKELGITDMFTAKVAETIISQMSNDYPELQQNKDFIFEQLIQEEEKFKIAIEEGLKAAEKIFASKKPIDRDKFVKVMQHEGKKRIIHSIFENKRQNLPYDLKEFGITKDEFDNASLSGEEAFYLYQSFGLPIEMILELAREKNIFMSKTVFENEALKHQELSRSSTTGKFKGGLADHSEATTRLHTANHLTLAALRQILGDHVFQKGSNITAERLRFDFSHPEKMTPEQIKKVEAIVNEQIQKALPVSWVEMPLEKAKELKAMGVFESKYGQMVKVYTIGDPNQPFSREICGGPHVQNTKELGHFQISKEEASSAGVRRIKAVLV